MFSLGFIASTLSILTVSGGLLLQIKKIWRQKKSDQFSFGWLILGMITWAGWLAYGLSIQDNYIVWANGIGLLLQTGLFVVVWRFRHN